VRRQSSVSTRPRWTARARRRGTFTSRPPERTGTRSAGFAFHCERRARVLARETFRFGTAMGATSPSSSSLLPAPVSAARVLRWSSSGSGLGVPAAELLHASGGVHDLLLTGVERVRRGGDVDVDHRVGVAVLPLHGVLRGDGGLRQDREVGGDVAEHHRVVLRVNVLLHVCFLRSSGGAGWALTGLVTFVAGPLTGAPETHHEIKPVRRRQPPRVRLRPGHHTHIRRGWARSHVVAPGTPRLPHTRHIDALFHPRLLRAPTQSRPPLRRSPGPSPR